MSGTETGLKRGDSLDMMLFCFLVVPGFLLYGWILKVTWGWFVVPALGIDELSIRNALGLALIASLLGTGKGLDKNKLFCRSLMESAILALVWLGIAFLVRGLRF